MVQLNNISNLNQLSKLLNISLKELFQTLELVRNGECYRKFSIPKKDGSKRYISAPCDSLREVQRDLAKLLSEVYSNDRVSQISHGFEEGRSIITNAKIHVKKRYVLNIDIKNFFDSFHYGRVKGYFLANRMFKLDNDIARVIATLTCHQRKLPQGAPTSPIITNLICRIMDYKIRGLSKKYKLDYTRYADDLTFSTNSKNFMESYHKFSRSLNKLIQKQGFEINEKKTRLMYRDSKQKVTGLVVNNKISVDRKYYLDTKSMALNLYKHGLYYIEKDRYKPSQGKYDSTKLEPLEGRFVFINSIDNHNRVVGKSKSTAQNLYNLNGRERQYQRFLFYKHFWKISRPVVFTEGPTDQQYIRAALLKYRNEYQNLIDSVGNLKFDFFLRNEKMSKFFGISQDGAVAMNNVYKYYFGGKINNYQVNPYSKIFSSYDCKPQFPFILLFDNELNNEQISGRPLATFEGYKKLDDLQKDAFKSNLWIKLNGEPKDCYSNLYLLTIPFDKESELSGKAEIEDLLPESVLNWRDKYGRTFQRKCDDRDKNYGKMELAEMVLEKYRDIDLSGFKPLLDNLNSIIMENLSIQDNY